MATLDNSIRSYIYRHFIRQMRAPKVAELADKFSLPQPEVRKSLRRLGASHAILTAENGELWRAAPFSAVPTPFPVRIGRRSWWANCIWDALGIPAILSPTLGAARIEASCGCCNYPMLVEITEGKLRSPRAIIHVAVPARRWYEDIVFT